MYFLNEVHIDGLRVDGTAWIRRTGADLGGGDVQDNPDGWSWLQYLNNSIDAQSPEKFIVAEDGYNGMVAGKLDVIAGLNLFQRIQLALVPLLPKRIVLSETRKLQEAG